MGRRSKAVKLVGGVRGGLALLDDDERRRVIEAGERDIDDGVGFFRGTARPRGTRVRGGGAEPATPVLGLQDTGTDRNRVLREPSGASRLTIRAEQKQAISMCQTARSRHPSFGYAARWSALAGVQLLVDRAGEHAVHSRTHDLQRRRQAGVLLGELRIQHHELAH